MRGGEYLSCCWPGLSRLWFKGESTALAAAVVFALALNGGLLLTWGWPVALGTPALALVWLVLAGVWLVAAWRAYRSLAAICQNDTTAEAEGLFIRAQTEYLRGNWFEAEGLALELIGRFPQDVEGQLLLASIHRRMKRLEDSARRLHSLARLPQAARWNMEIAAEAHLLETLSSEEQEQSAPAGAEDGSPARSARAA